MMDAAWLNIGSLVFGLIAWILPVVNIVKCNKENHRNGSILTGISVSACAISLCMQIFYTNHLVKIEDWSALMDTSDAIAMVSAVLLVVTIILNALVGVLYYRKSQRANKS